MSTPDTTTQAVDPAQPVQPEVPTQPVAPSESAGTQTAAGSPSEVTPPAVEPAPAPVQEVAAVEPITGEANGPTQPTKPDETPASPRPLGVAYDGRVYRKRDDNDVLSGHFCEVVEGEHEGRYGVLESTGTLGIDGYPDEVVVATRDADSENILVPYAAIRPAESGRR